MSETECNGTRLLGIQWPYSRTTFGKPLSHRNLVLCQSQKFGLA